MESGVLCANCDEQGHKIGRCPELYNSKPAQGGGGSHSHDDDDETVIQLLLNMFGLST